MIGNQHRAECEHTRGPRKRPPQPHPNKNTTTKKKKKRVKLINFVNTCLGEIRILIS